MNFWDFLKSIHAVFVVSKYCIFKCYHQLCQRGSYVETKLGRESAELVLIHEIHGTRKVVKHCSAVKDTFLCEVRKIAS